MRSLRAEDGRREGAGAVQYEGYGPGGAAVLVECRSADPAASRARVRAVFARNGGRLGATGAVSYLFNAAGVVSYPPGTDAAPLMRAALEAGAEDVVTNADTSIEVITDPAEFASVRASLSARGFAGANAEITLRAATTEKLSGDCAQAMLELLQELEALAEVRDVFTTAELPAELLERARPADADTQA